jgi:23S rRNA (guanosine2251-2'-O)-methyltransferase
MREWITGRNAVYETLRAGRRQGFRLLAAEGVQEKGRLAEITALARKRKIAVEFVSRPRLDSLSGGARGDEGHALITSHQGVALEASGYPYCAIQDIVDAADKRGEPPLIVILDMLQDPQNLGTLLRTCDALGVHGVLLPLRRTATVTPAVVNASAGASEHLLIAQANLAQAITGLKKAGLWVVGLQSEPPARDLDEVRLDGPLALVVGNEGEGMRPLVRASCDVLARLPMRGQVASLNAAVAGSIALYFAWQARKNQGIGNRE